MSVKHTSDRNPAAFRRKHWRRTRKGNVLRISRITQKTALQTINEFGLNRDYRIKKLEDGFISVLIRRGTNKILPPQRKFAASTIDLPVDEISKVLARFPDPLTELEIVAISNFVNKEMQSGNWYKYRYFSFLGMLSKNNSLVNWMKDGNQGVIQGTVDHYPGNGMESALSGYIDTKYTYDGSIAEGNLALGAFIAKQVDTAERTMLGTTSTYVNIDNTAGSEVMLVAIGGSGLGFVQAPNNEMVFTGGAANNQIVLYKDGSQLTSNVHNPTGLDSNNVYLLAGNNNGTALNHTQNRIASAFIAVGNGFDHVAYNKNIRELYADINAAAVINSFPTPLTASEITFVQDFLRSQVYSGNWQLIDSFAHFGLQDEANALWDWKRKAALTNNGATHIPNIGFDFNSGNIDTNYNPVVDGVNFKQDNLLFGLYYVEDNGVPNTIYRSLENANNAFIGGWDYGNGTGHVYGQPVSDTRTSYKVNINKWRDVLFIVFRIDNANNRFSENGNISATQASVAQAITSANFKLNGINFIGKLSSYLIGAAVGFDHQNYYDNLMILNANFQARNIIDSFPNPLSAEEETAVVDFIVSQIIAGNWGLIDSFAHFGLQNEQNALWDWKRKSAYTNTGGAHQPGIGFGLSGTNEINTNFAPAAGDNFKYTDAHFGFFVVQAGYDPTSPNSFMGASNSTYLRNWENQNGFGGRIYTTTSEALISNNPIEAGNYYGVGNNAVDRVL